jgi:outer membrane protein TolC
MKKKIIFLYLYIFLSLALFGQALNLEQARILALANSRSLARYELTIRSSILDERNQLYSMLPSISAEYRATMSYLRNWDFVNPADTFTTGASFSITQIIFQGGKSFIQRAINAIATESVRKDALAEYFNVLDAADNAYYAVLEAAATLEAEESSLQAAVLAFSIAEIRRASGMINQGDYLKALADLEARTNSRNQARRSLALYMTRFRAITGLEENAELEQIDFSAYEQVLVHLGAISDEQADVLFEVFWEMLAAANPSLAKAALNNQRAERSLSLTWRDSSPTINATIFSARIGNFITGNDTNSGGVSITGSIPVDFWILSNRVERSRIARDSAAIDYMNTESSLEQELQSSLLNALAQAGSVLSSRRSLEYTESHFEYVMERYRLSQSSVSDLNEASTLLITSRNNLIRASYGFLQSLSRLRSLCALDDEEQLISVLLGE